MRIVVMSDTHGNYSALEKIISCNPNADMFIHLGDGADEVNAICMKFQDISKRFFHVCGNCDFRSRSSKLLISSVGEHKLYAAHGHLHNVKYSLETLKKNAAENGCDIILYGHTHTRFMNYDNGVYIMNPGSASCPRDGNKPSYGYIEIASAGILTNIVDL